MSRRTKYILIIAGVLVLAMALSGGWWLTRKNSADLPSAGSPALSNPSGTLAVDPSTLKQATDAQQQVVNLETLARSFAERYGSHSNQSDFENLEDLFPFMTERMSRDSQKYVADQRAKKEVAIAYSGTTTKALSAAFVERADNSAVMNVATQRREIGSNSATPRIYYQDLTLTFVKVGEQWKVDKAEWGR